MPIASRTFRVFVSSTFEDLVEERNALQREVFPMLRQLCEAHGPHFQAIDLRWGVRDEAVLGQRMMDVCLAEIERCQRTRIKPNFIVLIGDRYGKPPLPARVQAHEFEDMLGSADSEAEALMESWYERDDNAIPAEYLLKPRTGELADANRWQEVQDTLGAALRKAARTVGLPADALLKYEGSASHQEIVKGLGATPEDRRHTFAFMRATDSAKEPPELAELKNFLRAQLGGNAVEYNAGDITGLCDDVRASLSKVILEEVSRFESRTALELELEAHHVFARERSRQFTGRALVLDAITDYLKRSDLRPLVVHGPSGSGKSAIIAKASEDHGGIRRFIGATPEASNGLTLLRSLCEEIGERYGQEGALPATFNELVVLFQDRLRMATADRPIILHIDALDQLGTQDPAAAADWLPRELPPYCRVVLSTIDVSPILANAELVPVTPLSVNEAGETLDLWLRDAKRTLRDDQRAKVLAESRLPLYLKLAFEEARLWKSFDPIEECALGEGLPGIIDRLFARLSEPRNHGQVLARTALGFLAAARYGLTEDEMLDVLAANDAVWRDFEAARRHDLPDDVRRLPVIVWSRLYLDLEPYLTERAVPGGTAISFYHRKLAERVAKDKSFHAELARYFGQQSNWRRPQLANERRMTELVRQQLGAELPGESEVTLTDLDFLSAKCAAGLVFDLQEDYQLCSLAYLGVRTADGGVHQLVADHALATEASETAAWSEFIRRHAQRLFQHPKMLLSLVQFEGFPAAREQLKSRTWSFPWLRSSPVSVPRGEEPLDTVPLPSGLRIVTEDEVKFSHGRVSGLAPKAGLVFEVERLGTVRVLDCANMRELPARLAIGASRPVKVYCAPDASSLMVFFDTGEAELHTCTVRGDGLPVGTSVAARFRYHLPEIDDPVVEWKAGGYWLQTHPQKLARVDALTGEIAEQPLPKAVTGELAALLFLRGDRRFIAVRQANSVVLFGTGDAALWRERVDVCAACPCEDLAVVAFSDGEIVTYDVTATPVPRSTVKAGIIRGALGWDGERLLWLGESSGFAKLHAWRPNEQQSTAVQDTQKVFPAHLDVVPRSWLNTAKNTTLIVTSHSVVRFRLQEGSSTTASRVDWLFGGPVWRAVRREENTQWLWEDRRTRAIRLGTDIPGRTYCAPDGGSFFYMARVDRAGLILNLSTLQTATLRYAQVPLNSAAGDPDGGCWFADRTGGIYYSGIDGNLRLAATVDEGSGPVIQICGEILVWRGFVPKWHSETGVDRENTLVFFRRESGAKQSIERVGERSFAIREGFCIAMDHDPSSGRLVMLWHREHDTPVLRIGFVEDFLENRFVDHVLGEVGLLGTAQMAVSPNGKVVGIVNVSGKFVCVGIADGKEIATLATSVPFTHVARGGSDNTFWLVEGLDVIYECSLVQPA